MIAIVCLIGILCTTILLHEIASSSDHSFVTRTNNNLTIRHTKNDDLDDDDDDENANENMKRLMEEHDNNNVADISASIDCPPYDRPIYPMELPTIEPKTETDDGDTSPGRGQIHSQRAMTQKGQDHVVNQDRGIILLRKPYAPNDSDRHDDGRLYFSMGLFDGHGDEGHHVAQYLQQNFFSKLESKLRLQEEENIEAALNETFVELDRELDPSIGNDGGSTAAIVLYRPPRSPSSPARLYFASVGDSLCILADARDGTVLFRTTHDKAHTEEERDRILTMGGKIHVPPLHPLQARSVAWSKTLREMVSLAMSRAIGDWEHLGVIATPHVDEVELPTVVGGGGFVVACGSDGMFDARRPEFVAQQLAEFGVGRVAHLIEVATPMNPNVYRDDITLLALRVGA